VKSGRSDFIRSAPGLLDRRFLVTGPREERVALERLADAEETLPGLASAARVTAVDELVQRLDAAGTGVGVLSRRVTKSATSA